MALLSNSYKKSVAPLPYSVHQAELNCMLRIPRCLRAFSAKAGIVPLHVWLLGVWD